MLTWIGRRGYSRHHCRRGERCLFNVREVVVGLDQNQLTRDKRYPRAYIYETHIAVQGKLSELPQGEVLMRPDLGHIKDVPAVILCLRGLHYLRKDSPCRVLAPLNGFEHVLDQEIWILASHRFGLLSSEVTHSLICLYVELDVSKTSILIPPKLAAAKQAVTNRKQRPLLTAVVNL